MLESAYHNLRYQNNVINSYTFFPKKLKFTVKGGEAILSAQILIDHLRAFIIQKFFQSRINVLEFKF
jgi:hypothetical protein